MCGICGIYGPGGSQAAVEAMLAAMARRGPDGTGLWSEDDILMGHRRLAIVDLSERGRQPMRSTDGTITISVNGEIYNYPELRAELEAQGAVFQSNCDSETVIHAYRAWGPASFARYNGMFAIALWDGPNRRLYLLRDRLGIKPLYYWLDGARTFFASDVQAIIAASGRGNWPISRQGLSQYLSYQNRFGAQTMFEAIRLVLPGHYVEINATGRREQRYAEVAPAARGLADFPAAVEGFRHHFRAAVSRHLMSDVPVASYLSSGFDSAMVTSAAAELLDRRGPATFTGTFREGGWYDEGTGALLVTKRHELLNTRVEIDASAFRDAFDEMVFALEEPRMGTGALPQYLVARKVAETHKMVLTGHGGDEFFSGYPVFKFALLSRLLWRSPIRFLRLLAGIRSSEIPHIAYFALSSLFRRGGLQFLPRLFGLREQSRGLRPGYRLAGSSEKLVGDAPKMNAGAGAYERLIGQYLNAYLPGLLIVEDKISMAHGLESRTPFLDNELLSFALSIDEATKLDHGALKAVIKAAARGRLPDEFYALPKRGFPNPLSKWLRGELSDWMTARLTGPDTMLAQLFERNFLQRTVSTYLSSWKRRLRPLDEIATHRIFMLLCLESWLRQYRDRMGVALVAPTQTEPAE
ncbi:asparagine synthase (glutamine-hydrolyzing) [Bosea sp. (in: a-proteobacteria)]